ncbi:MAG: ATP-binding cassette domain-containing protein [Gammaproteobacteria bacterium]|nr:ATP-binding cassette domain-containing protein [Gammaproteobacteria bacterium]MCP5146397.1 ATP-binding cassette domain-containing protein [Gammaproteobacteria bacterium]
MIVVQGIAKRFISGRARSQTTVEAVSDVSFVADDGRILGLLGPNGAGKTTTLRMIAAQFPPDRGTITVDHLDVGEQPYHALACMGVLSDARGLYPRLTALENIIYYGELHGMTRPDAVRRARELADILELSDLLDRRTIGFSQGERMKTALARALVHDPGNIILDEPTNGLDVLATRSLRNTLRRLRDDLGKCIVFSTHIMQEVERLCDDVVIVSHGKTVANGSVAEISARAGTSDFEDAFVALAFSASERANEQGHA